MGDGVRTTGGGGITACAVVVLQLDDYSVSSLLLESAAGAEVGGGEVAPGFVVSVFAVSVLRTGEAGSTGFAGCASADAAGGDADGGDAGSRDADWGGAAGVGAGTGSLLATVDGSAAAGAPISLSILAMR